MTDSETAARVGITQEDHLFGGVVPHPYMATKAITHPLINSYTFAPKGWSDHFARRVRNATLFGFCAFTLADARAAGAIVLKAGPVRVKPGNGVGGRGQSVAENLGELDQALVALGEGGHLTTRSRAGAKS